MARRSQPYRLRWPLTAQQLGNIDDMFQLLFDDTHNGAIDVRASQIRSGVIAVARGGTGIGTYDVGDMLYADEIQSLAVLAIGASGKVIRSDGTIPAYSTFTISDTFATGSIPHASASNTVTALAIGSAGQIIRSTGTLPAYSTFTIPNTFAQGDLIYGSATNVLTALAKDANATRYLSNTGASNNPAWAQVNLANGVTGDLPFANLTQIAGQSILGVTGIAGGDVAAITASTDHQVLRRSGTTLAFGAVNLAQAAAVTGTLAVTNGGTGTATTFTEGSIIFANVVGAYAQDNANLFWDDTNNRLGIGTASPAESLHVSGNIRGTQMALGGVTISANRLFTIGGTFAGSSATQAFSVNSTLQPPANTEAYGGFFDLTFEEAGSGNHALLAGLRIGVGTVTGGAATVTNTAALYIEGAMSATVTGANYALWVDAGMTRLDGTVILGDVVRLKGYTVATLPAGTQGDTAFVTDALAPTFLTALTGGGAVVTPAFYDGTNWVSF